MRPFFHYIQSKTQVLEHSNAIPKVFHTLMRPYPNDWPWIWGTIVDFTPASDAMVLGRSLALRPQRYESLAAVFQRVMLARRHTQNPIILR